MTTDPPTLRDRAIDAVGQALNARNYWLPVEGRPIAADAVLALLGTGQPAERCGDMIDGVGGGWLECVLRPGHQGSHADHDNTRWTLKPAVGPTADEYQQLRAELDENTGVLQALRRQRDEAETEARRLSAILRLLPAASADLRGQIIEAICTWADHTSANPDSAADAVIAVMARHAAIEPPEESPDA